MKEHILLSHLLYIDAGKPDFATASENVFAMKSGAQLAFCNRVFGTAQTSIDEIEAVKQYYQATPFCWFVKNTEHTLIEKLEKTGLHYKTSFPAMSATLQGINPVSYADHVSVKKIGPADLATWISIVVKTYNIPAEDQFAQFVTYLTNKAGADKVHLYLGYYDNIPVGASMAIDHPDMVGLHWVATLTEYRNKGIGYAVSYQPLIDAQERNLSKALLFASKSGQPLYEKIGFREYALYNIYG